MHWPCWEPPPRSASGSTGWGPHAPLLAGLLGTTVATVAFAAAIGIEQIAGSMLFLARAAQGVAAAVSWTAGLALIAVTHKPSQRGRAMGLALSAAWFGALLGPAASGILADSFGLGAGWKGLSLPAKPEYRRPLHLPPVGCWSWLTPPRTVRAHLAFAADV